MAHLNPLPTMDAGEDRTMILNMGPQHPSTHGVLRVILEIDGENVVRIMPDIGYLHTGIEKTCEAKFYQQVVPLTDRSQSRSCWAWRFLPRPSGCEF
jgi:NADH-quinone oxidoreductase subunit D